MRPNGTRLTTALLGGALGGIAGTWAMATADALWSAVDQSGGPVAQARRLKRSGVGGGHFAQSEPRSHEDSDTPSQLLARRLPGVDTPRRERIVGSAIHFAFGAAAGATYAAAVATAPPHVARVLRSGHGLLYGTLVWLLADEIGVPLAGLAPPPHRTPPRLHAYALAGHFAYGLALESVRSLTERRAAGAEQRR
jgi:hypothetical protein